MQFDPYYTWLGIPPEEQPPTHYRLLGLRDFEASQDVIANAADRQMSYVRTFQSGRYREDSQRVLNEIAAARLCLLTAERKDAYDAALRAKQRSSARVTESRMASAPPVPRAAASAPAAAVPHNGERPLKPPPLRSSVSAGSSSSQEVAIAGPTLGQSGESPLAGPMQQPPRQQQSPAVPMSAPGAMPHGEYGLAPPEAVEHRFTAPLDSALQASALAAFPAGGAGAEFAPPRFSPSGNSAQRSSGNGNHAKFIILALVGAGAALAAGLLVTAAIVAGVLLNQPGELAEGDVTAKAPYRQPDSAAGFVASPASPSTETSLPTYSSDVGTGGAEMSSGVAASGESAIGSGPAFAGPTFTEQPVDNTPVTGTLTPFGATYDPSRFPEEPSYEPTPTPVSPMPLPDDVGTDPAGSSPFSPSGVGISPVPTEEDVAGMLPGRTSRRPGRSDPRFPPLPGSARPGMPTIPGFDPLTGRPYPYPGTSPFFPPGGTGSTYGGPREPVPMGDDLRTVTALKADLQTAFRGISPSNAPARLANTQSLLDRALAEADAVDQYAILEQAYVQAETIVNYRLAKQILAEITLRFEVDQLQRRMEFVSRFVTQAELRNEVRSVLVDAMQLVDEAMAEDRYDEAEKLRKVAERLGQKIGDSIIVQQAKQKEIDIRNAKRESATAPSTGADTESEPSTP
ncbi:MAG: hypothetical protein WEH44_05140 [Pirellulaceae bacterium]